MDIRQKDISEFDNGFTFGLCAWNLQLGEAEHEVLGQS